MKKLYPILITLSLFSCREMMTDNTEETFLAFWKTLDDNYSYFEEKGINWDSIYNVYYPQAQQSKYNEELAAIFQKIITQINDEYVWIYRYSNKYWSDIRSEHFVTRADTLYVNNDYYRLTNDSVYRAAMEIDFGLYKKWFNETQSPFRFWQDTVKKYTFIAIYGNFYDDKYYDYCVQPERLLYFLDSLSYQNGIIIDIRQNYSKDEKILDVASFFFENELIAFYEKVRLGAGRDNFSEKTPKILTGQGKISANIPVVVITGPSTAMAANYFANVMKQLPNCKIVGEQSEGFRYIADRQMITLPNYWNLHYPLIVSKKYDAQGNNLDLVGVKPDIFVEMRNFWRYNMKDSMIMKALEILDSANGF